MAGVGWLADLIELESLRRHGKRYIGMRPACPVTARLGGCSGASAEAELLEQMGWNVRSTEHRRLGFQDPPLAGDFHHPGLV